MQFSFPGMPCSNPPNLEENSQSFSVTPLGFSTAGKIGSMSRRGNCWDNAVVERVFRSVKHEGLDETVRKQAPETVKALVIDYMEMFYNSQRFHATLGVPESKCV